MMEKHKKILYRSIKRVADLIGLLLIIAAIIFANRGF